MEKGIALSPDLFDQNKIMVFFFEELLGSICEGGTMVKVEPVNQNTVELNDRDKAIEYLMEIRNRQFKQAKIKKDISQLPLF